MKMKWVGHTKYHGHSVGLTGDRRATDAVDFRLHFALTKVGYDAARIVVNKYVRSLVLR